jgi:hypothetical protein
VDIATQLPPVRIDGIIDPTLPGNNKYALKFRRYDYMQINPSIEEPDAFTNLPQGDYSLALWMKTMPKFEHLWDFFLSKGESYRISRYSTTPYVRYFVGGTGDLYSNTPVEDGQWHHVAGIFRKPTRVTGGGLKFLYVDGVLDGTQAVTSEHTIYTDPLMIGGNATWIGREFTGGIDDVRIYRNRALRAVDVEDLYNMRIINNGPKVNLGDNVILTPPGPYQTTIIATISDDGEIVKGSPTMTWSKVDGPGTVGFTPTQFVLSPFVPNVDHFPSTNITFSEPGFYTLSLKADDGYYETEDIVRVWIQPQTGMSRSRRTSSRRRKIIR